MHGIEWFVAFPFCCLCYVFPQGIRCVDDLPLIVICGILCVQFHPHAEILVFPFVVHFVQTILPVIATHLWGLLCAILSKRHVNMAMFCLILAIQLRGHIVNFDATLPSECRWRKPRAVRSPRWGRRATAGIRRDQKAFIEEGSNFTTYKIPNPLTSRSFSNFCDDANPTHLHTGSS